MQWSCFDCQIHFTLCDWIQLKCNQGAWRHTHTDCKYLLTSSCCMLCMRVRKRKREWETLLLDCTPAQTYWSWWDLRKKRAARFSKRSTPGAGLGLQSGFAIRTKRFWCLVCSTFADFTGVFSGRLLYYYFFSPLISTFLWQFHQPFHQNPKNQKISLPKLKSNNCVLAARVGTNTPWKTLHTVGKPTESTLPFV